MEANITMLDRTHQADREEIVAATPNASFTDAGRIPLPPLLGVETGRACIYIKYFLPW